MPSSGSTEHRKIAFSYIKDRSLFYLYLSYCLLMGLLSLLGLVSSIVAFLAYGDEGRGYGATLLALAILSSLFFLMFFLLELVHGKKREEKAHRGIIAVFVTGLVLGILASILTLAFPYGDAFVDTVSWLLLSLEGLSLLVESFVLLWKGERRRESLPQSASREIEKVEKLPQKRP